MTQGGRAITDTTDAAGACHGRRSRAGEWPQPHPGDLAPPARFSLGLESDEEYASRRDSAADGGTARSANAARTVTPSMTWSRHAVASSMFAGIADSARQPSPADDLTLSPRMMGHERRLSGAQAYDMASGERDARQHDAHAAAGGERDPAVNDQSAETARAIQADGEGRLAGGFPTLAHRAQERSLSFGSESSSFFSKPKIFRGKK